VLAHHRVVLAHHSVVLAHHRLVLAHHSCVGASQSCVGASQCVLQMYWHAACTCYCEPESEAVSPMSTQRVLSLWHLQHPSAQQHLQFCQLWPEQDRPRGIGAGPPPVAPPRHSEMDEVIYWKKQSRGRLGTHSLYPRK
jgi:hypothetical protein